MAHQEDYTFPPPFFVFVRYCSMGFWSFRFGSTKLYRLLAERINGFEGNFDIFENATMGKIENYEIWAWEHFTLQSRTGPDQGQKRVFPV